MAIDEHARDTLESLLRQAASDLSPVYPPTPPIAAVVHRQLSARRRTPAARARIRLIRAVAVAAAIFVALLLVSPDVREAVARFFGLETVRIERVATLPPASVSPPTATPAGEVTPASTSQSATPQPADPFGLTTLAEARAQARFEIGLPGSDLPARVYLQDLAFAQQVILIYPDFTIYEAEGAVYRKIIGSSTLVEEVKVGGQPGLWLAGGEHMIQIQSPSGELIIDFRRVEGNVLAWEDGGTTYRIETKLSLEEALRIAESIR